MISACPLRPLLHRWPNKPRTTVRLKPLTIICVRTHDHPPEYVISSCLAVRRCVGMTVWGARSVLFNIDYSSYSSTLIATSTRGFQACLREKVLHCHGTRTLHPSPRILLSSKPSRLREEEERRLKLLSIFGITLLSKCRLGYMLRISFLFPECMCSVGLCEVGFGCLRTSGTCSYGACQYGRQ